MALFITRQAIYALSARIKDASTSTRDLITFRGEIHTPLAHLLDFLTGTRHVRVRHVDKSNDDPQLKPVLSQMPEGRTRGRKYRTAVKRPAPCITFHNCSSPVNDSRNASCVGISSQNLALAVITCKCNEEVPCGVPVCRTVRDK
jgi:hypothetical protein